MNIEIIAASPRKESVTYRVALFLQKYMAEKTEHNVNIIDVREWAFPLMQQEVFSSVERTPETLKPLAQRMFDANGFIMVSPEYNGSYTSALKNLFDHFPKQTHKTFGIVTASPGIMGGMRASQQMQLLINALFAPRSAAFHPFGECHDVAGGELCTGWHLEFAVVPDSVDQDAVFGLSGDNGGATAAALEQGFPIEERDSAIIQFLVVAAEAAFCQYGRDALVEVARVVFRGRLRGCNGRHCHQGEYDSIHFFFIPTPN